MSQRIARKLPLHDLAPPRERWGFFVEVIESAIEVCEGNTPPIHPKLSPAVHVGLSLLRNDLSVPSASLAISTLPEEWSLKGMNFTIAFLISLNLRILASRSGKVPRVSRAVAKHPRGLVHALHLRSFPPRPVRSHGH